MQVDPAQRKSNRNGNDEMRGFFTAFRMTRVGETMTSVGGKLSQARVKLRKARRFMGTHIAG